MLFSPKMIYHTSKGKIVGALVLSGAITHFDIQVKGLNQTWNCSLIYVSKCVGANLPIYGVLNGSRFEFDKKNGWYETLDGLQGEEHQSQLCWEVEDASECECEE